jgi:hypothetical protein
MESANNVQLGNAEIQRFAGFFQNLFERELESVRIALFAREGTELAAQDAVVGIVDVAIEDETRPRPDFLLARQVGDGSKGVEVTRFEKTLGVCVGDPFAASYLVVNIA